MSIPFFIEALLFFTHTCDHCASVILLLSFSDSCSVSLKGIMTKQEYGLFMGKLFVPLQKKLRQGFEGNGFALKSFQRGEGLGGQLFRDLP